MTRIHACLLGACWWALWGCTEVAPPQAAAQPEAAPAERREDPGVVRLSPEAIRRADVLLGRVESRELPDLVRAPGELALNADRTVHAAAFVEGVVTDCCKSVGAFVRKGEILVEMHSHQTHELLAEFRQARAALEARRSELIYAERDHERAQRLHELKAGTLQRVQETETAVDRARTAVESADAELAGAIAHFEYLGIETTELRQGRIPEHLVVHVRAPISGVIVVRAVALGAVVTPSDPLYEVSDLNSLWLIVRVPEQDLKLVRPGMVVDFRVKAYSERTFRGRVETVGDMLDPHTKTVLVRCVVSNPKRALKQGMFGEAVLRSRQTRAALVVPESAVQRIDDTSVVFIPAGDGGYSPQAVEAGRNLDGMEEIRSGLEAGDEIVINGAFALKSELLKARFAEE